MQIKYKVNTVFFVLVVCFFQLSCTTTNINKYTGFQKPVIRFQKFKIVSVTSKKVSLNILFNVDNPNDITIDSLFIDYELFVKNKSFIKGLKAKLKLIPKGSSIISLPVNISYQQLKASASSVATLLVQGKRNLPMSIVINIYGEIKLAKVFTQDYMYQHTVNTLIPLPKYSMNDVQQFIQGVR